MRGKWIVGAVVAAAAIAGATASSVLGGDSSPRPDYATIDLKVEPKPSAPANPHQARKARKPRVIYLQGSPSIVDVSATGPYIDVRVSSCPGSSKVIGGGAYADNTNIYEQGTYIPNDREYHVLLGFDDDGPAQAFTISSHLTCLKGAK